MGIIGRTWGARWILPAALFLAGCYGGKVVRMPINTDLTSKRLDTLQTRQEKILRELSELSRLLREEREARVRENADASSRLGEIERALEILSNKVDDTMQLMERVRPVKRDHVPRVPVDTFYTARAAPESTETTGRPPPDAEKLFQAALMDLMRGNYSLAADGFRNYLETFPSGPRLAEVHYYLGESFYSMERYVEALAEYQTVMKEYADSRLAPSAYLKAGMSYSSMDEPALAEKTFRELISKYPYSEEAEHARAALKDLGG